MEFSYMYIGMEALCKGAWKPFAYYIGSPLQISMVAHFALVLKPFAQANTNENRSPLLIEMDSLCAFEWKPIAYWNRSPLHIEKEAIL